MDSLVTFKRLLEQYLIKANCHNKDLAAKVNLSDAEFSRRLNGKSKTNFSVNEIQLIIATLADWHGIKTRQEAHELLSLMNAPDFTSEQWKRPPLNKLLDLITETAKTAETTPLSQNPVLYPSIIDAPSVQVRLKRSRPCPPPPPPPDHFGGRYDELTELKMKIIAGEEIFLTAVMGLGGIGKTTVARKLAYDLYTNLQEKVFCSVLWKEIKKNPDPMNQLLEWAYLADPAFVAGNTRPEQLTHQVRALLDNLIEENCKSGKAERVLVVFDDVWDDGIETVRLLRQACPTGATILITSRSEKASQMLSKQVVKLNKLNPENGVLLLREYLPGFDQELLKQLAIVLDGHALAMTIAARRLLLEEGHEREQLLKQHINQYEQGLPVGVSFNELELGEDKEDNLAKALYYSYAELEPLEQKLFRYLGILPYNAPFDYAMLEAIWGVNIMQVKAVSKRLRLLSLIDVDEISVGTYGGNWYRQHPLVQSYANYLLNNTN